MKLLLSFALSFANGAICYAHTPSLPDLKFQKIQAKSFLMGSADSEGGRNFDENLHMVTLTKDFDIQLTTITQNQWFQVMGTNPSEFNKSQFCPNDHVVIEKTELCPKLPVESISFAAIQEYILKLNSLDEKFRYRLPSEAEWEMAARGDTGTSYFFGDDATDMDLYLVEGTEQPAQVASKLPNQFGLYDMLGNVSQWVQDYWDIYPFIDFEHPTIDPHGPKSGEYRVVRGGSWDDYVSNRFRSATRKFVESKAVANTIGFRLVREEKL